MKIIFAGTPEPAAEILELLIKAKHEIVLVVTQPDKPQGRGQKVAFPAVKELALKHHLPIDQIGKFIVDSQPDLIVVAAYGKILPKAILDLPRFGCLNIHASLLPKYRGAAPIQWALLNGEQETGVTIMKMDEGLDTGEIVAQTKIKIGPDDNANDLFEKLFAAGGELLLKVLGETEELKNLRTYEQDDALATRAPMIKKEQAEIDWTKTASEIHNQIRGLVLWPMAQTACRKNNLKILAAEISDGKNGQPGEIISIERGRGVEVSTGEKNILLKQVQPAGKKIMPAYDFALGARLRIGEILPN